MFQKTLFILRGVPGCGKSTVADLIACTGMTDIPNSVICCTDDYFVDKNGNYNWNPKEIYRAHVYCQNKCQVAMLDNTTKIIIANTNTTPKDFKEYERLAENYGYRVFHLVVENRHGGKNVHNVPAETLINMETKLKNSIKLL